MFCGRGSFTNSNKILDIMFIAFDAQNFIEEGGLPLMDIYFVILMLNKKS